MSFLRAQFAVFDVFTLEMLLTASALIAALVRPRSGGRFFAAIEHSGRALARHTGLTLLAVTLAPIVLRALLVPVLPYPQPIVPDEFSYLLAGDTFAHGRLANAPHALGEFFESPYVLQRPVYASMYPPMQGLFLALGEWLGRPWFGVCLSAGLMCGALFWMLRGWFPPGWALLGAAIAVMRLGIFSYWMNSHWGGAPSALGGALAAGALPRLWRRPRAWHAAAMGLGFVILANSRPYEGFFFALPLAIGLGWHGAWRRMAPAVCVLAIGAAATGYYNQSITGKPWITPQWLAYRTYAASPMFVFQKPRPEPVYPHAALRDFYAGPLARAGAPPMWLRLGLAYWFFLGPLLAVPFVLGSAAWFSRKRAVLMAALVAVIGAIALENFATQPHYYAPATCAIYAALVASLRRLRHWRWRVRPVGLLLARMTPALCAIMIGVRLAAAPLDLALPLWPYTWADAPAGNLHRARMQYVLAGSSEPVLVLVRYHARPGPRNQWVYNEADIDHAPVVWAHDLEGRNQRLLDYFHGRRVVLIDPDLDPERALPYP